MFKRKVLTISVSILCLLGSLNVLVSLGAICPQGVTQVSETFISGDAKTFNFDVTNVDVGRLDLFIEVTGATATPTFSVAIDNNVGDGLAATPFTFSPPVGVTAQDQPFSFMASGQNYIDIATLQRLNAADPNRYLLSILFSSYHNFSPLCGPKCELGDLGCTAATALPPVDRRQRTVTVTIGGFTAAGHLQVNGVSKKCISPPMGLPNEALSPIPAKVFIDSGVGACPAKKPTDVIVLLDHSGSMTGPASTGAVVSRITVLNNSMLSFFNLWKEPGPPPQFDPLDQAGAVFFSSSSLPQTFGSFLVPFTATPGTNLNLTNLINASTTHVIIGDPATAMGPGLQSAFDGFGATSNYRQIVLFTDGQQNVPPCVKPSTAVADPRCNLTGGPIADSYVLNNVELRAHAVPIHAIGTGSASGTPYEVLLRRISLDTGGQPFFTVSGSDVEVGFLQALVNIFRGNTLGLVAYREATIAKGAGTTDQKFLINRSARRLAFLLSWDAENPADQVPGALTMDVFPPGSAVPIAASHNVDTNSHHIRGITIPIPSGPTAHEGEWTLRVKENLTGASQIYHAAAFVDESKLEYSLGAIQSDYSTGTPIRLQALVTQDGVPVKNLSTVTTAVTRPRTPLGTFMHNQQITPADLQNNPPGQPADGFNNNFDRKLFRLVTNPALQPLFDPIRDPQSVQLFDDGLAAHGDALPSDGVYSALYSNTKFPGQYVFDFSVAGNTALLGNFSRTEKSIALVRVNNPDPNKSEVSVDPTFTAGQYLITVVPADTFGNFLGPGFANEINISVSGGGAIAGPIVDTREDGTYTTNLTGVPSGANPIVTVTVSGKVIANAPVSVLSKPKQKFAIFGGLGVNFPHGSFNTVFNSGLSSQFGFEYRFTNRVSAEGTFGYDRFPFAFGPSHLNLYRGSGNIKAYPVIGTFQFGVFGGGGVYQFGSGGTHGGVNIGMVGEYRVNTSVSLESTYNFHNVFTSGSNTRFSTVQGGVRLRF